MRASFGLPSVENDEMEGKPPITVNFEIPYFTVSGIQVSCVCAPACEYTVLTFENKLMRNQSGNILSIN